MGVVAGYGPARAQDPATVATVIQMGVAAASLFGPKGADLGDLINSQTAILMGISAKIDTVMGAIKVIDARLQELKRIVSDLPNDTVKALKTVEINGASHQLFGEVFPGYLIDKNALGILKANSVWVPKVQSEILPALAAARTQLMLFDTPFAVPVLCVALQSERMALAFAGGTTGETQTLKNVYSNYFSAQIGRCTLKRTQVRGELLTLLEEIKSGQVMERAVCLVKGSSTRAGLECPNGTYLVQTSSYVPTAAPKPALELANKDQYKPLFERKLIQAEDFPPVLNQTYTKTDNLESKVVFRDQCPETFYKSSPTPFQELAALVGNRYGKNLARTLSESGKFCPNQDTRDGTAANASLAGLQVQYENRFNELCFYAAMQLAAENAATSLNT